MTQAERAKAYRERSQTCVVRLSYDEIGQLMAALSIASEVTREQSGRMSDIGLDDLADDDAARAEAFWALKLRLRNLSGR